MDKAVAKQAIERIEAEKAIHDSKFAGRAEHSNCLPRFDKVLANLYKDIEPFPRDDSTTSVGALPDAIESAMELKSIAKELAATQPPEAANLLEEAARKVVSKELNELDGFDR